MTLIFKSIKTEGIAQLSYLVGDTSTGRAGVIDPRPDCDVYLQLARAHRLAITEVFETHIHADFMSGARELAARCGSARVCASREGGATYQFSPDLIGDGDRFEYGSTLLTARHTPGHTPEHLSYELADKGDADNPWGVLSGDTLFVASAGRPDLLGDEQADPLAEQLFRSLRDYFLSLDDGVLIFPCHGAGSACGASIGDRPISSIGRERQTNPFLQIDSLDDFKKIIFEGAPPAPRHYPHLKKVNADGPEILGRLPVAPALPPEHFKAAVDENNSQLVDVRTMLSFGGGHIPGALNIGQRNTLSVWAGWMLDYEKPILLVLEQDQDLDRILRLFWHTGFNRFTGYLAGGMRAWNGAGLPIQRLPQLSVHELQQQLDRFQVLDVRKPEEWDSGHLPGAIHHFVPDLIDGTGLDDLDPERPVATFCGSGYRANIAASILQARGFEQVYNVPGSWKAWKNSGYPTTNE